MDQPGDKRIIRVMAIILALLMVCRHLQFYGGYANIRTEMGHDQDMLGFLLIPVTASFGCFLFFGRKAFVASYYEIIKLFVICLVLVAYWVCVLDITIFDAFSYSFLDSSRRPSFLILFPIFLSLLYTFFGSLLIRSILVLCAVLFFIVYDSFIAYYFLMFICFRFINFVNFFNYSPFLLGSGLVLIFISACVAHLVFFERVFFVLEFFWTLTFLLFVRDMAVACVRVLDKFSNLNYQYSVSFSILYFYIIQGVAFTLIREYIPKLGPFLTVLVIFIFSFGVSSLIVRFEKSIKMKLLIS
jgi:hypothetical protein